MEEVYVVKVRSKPCASRLFPSERRYSASTVGGLGAIHLLLALTCLLLGSLHMLALPGPAPGYGAGLGLGAASTLAGLAGLLAWRRWYVDNNIRWFFISSSVSGLTALLCIVLTAVTLAVSQESLNRLHLAAPTKPSAMHTPARVAVNTTATHVQDLDKDQATEHPAKLGDSQAGRRYRSETVVEGSQGHSPATDLVAEETVMIDSSNLLNDTSTWLHQYGGPDISRNEVRSVVAINIIVASTLELVWSVLSAKIAWKGMRNLYSDEGDSHPDGADKTKEEEKIKQKKEAMGNKPDIICNHKRGAAPKIESRRDSSVSHEPMPRHMQDDGPCLPPMERTMDFQEKIQRFLESNREHYLNMNARDM